MIKQEHYSLRINNNKQGTGLLSPVLTDSISKWIDRPFDPYQEYKLIYEEYFLPIFSPDHSVSAESKAYLGTTAFQKYVSHEYSIYTLERSMHADEDKRAAAECTSLTRYSHNARNDIYCTIPRDSLASQHYKVIRGRYHQDLAGIYEYSQQDSADCWGDGDTGTTRLLTNVSILDVVQKLSFLHKPNRKPIVFDFLENMEYVKPHHKLTYIDSIQASFGGKRVRLNGFCQTGAGTLPTYYWATDSGLLIYIRNGIHLLVLTGREG